MSFCHRLGSIATPELKVNAITPADFLTLLRSKS